MGSSHYKALVEEASVTGGMKGLDGKGSIVVV